MRFFRLIKPIWAHEKKANGEPNPNFKQVIKGPNTFEGVDFTPEYLKQKNKEGYDIYFFPNHPGTDVYAEGTKHLNGRQISNFNFLFVDMDLKDGIYKTREEFYQVLRDFEKPPTFVISSGHGIHAYWKVTDLNRDAYLYNQLSFLEHFKTDPSVWTALQLMRYPGYLNKKDFDKPVKCELIREASSNNSYLLEDFSDIVPSATNEQCVKAELHMARLDGKLDLSFSRQEVDVDELPDKFLDLCLKESRIANLFDDPEAGGNRSEADMTLCHLLYSRKFTVSEAFSVICNTQKALSKGLHRKSYAALTVAKTFERRKINNFQTVGEFLATKEGEVKEPKVNGPFYLDGGILGEPWRRKEILGLISGSGIGKTAFSLNIIVETILNNQDSDDVYVFISLEMTKAQIIERWISMVGVDSPMANRLYVIDTLGSDNVQKMIGLQEIYSVCSEIKQHTGKHIGMLIIDHMHILSTHIDLRVKPTFGIEAEGGTGYGNIRNLSLNQLATQLNSLVQVLDTFLIILSQTTKEKGVGDIPIFKDGCYGVSNFDWICARIITLWQPLLRVQSRTELRILAFHYAKIREIRNADKLKVYEPKLLTYDIIRGKLQRTTPEEYQEFKVLAEEADIERAKVLTKKGIEYSVI